MSQSLFKSTSLVSLMTLLSRILGFVRDMVAAQIFGATAEADAFNVAFKIPNFMRNLFAEGSFSQAFVPVLSQYRQQRSQVEVKEFISHTLAGLGSILTVVTIIGVLAAPLLVSVFAPGLDDYRFGLSSHMLRITFPYLMLISLTAFTGSILNSYSVFGIPSFTPTLLNICLIIAAVWVSPYFDVPILAQAWGVLVAGLVQLGFQLPFLQRLGFLTLPRLNWQDEGVRRILKLMVPALFGASVTQINLLISTIFASFLITGSVTWLYYSERLAYFPLGVFGVALATVVLPHLSRKHAEKLPQQFMQALDWGIRCNLLIGIPAVVTLLLLAGPMLTTLFQYGKFNANDVAMAQQSVMAYAVGLQAFMLLKLLSTGYYARQDIRTPVRTAIIATIANLVLSAFLIGPLAHAGLALATSLSSTLNACLLFRGLYRQGIFRFQSGWLVFSMRLMFANVLVAIWLWWSSGNITKWLNWTGHQRGLQLLLIMIIAMVIYLAGLWLSGLRLKDLKFHTS